MESRGAGALRYAGFPLSRWWTENELGNHAEATTFEEPLVILDQQIKTDNPVRATVRPCPMPPT